MKKERLKEDWVEFVRFYFKKGYIDIWSGDCINDPNNENKSPLNLNAFATYIRVNDGKWINRRNFNKKYLYDIYDPEIRELFGAEEFWNESITAGGDQ